MLYLVTNMFLKQFSLPGQGRVLQGTSSLRDPGQSVPPLDGGGFKQSRNLFWLPSPQVLEHDPLDHSLHIPLTGSGQIYKLIIKNTIYGLVKGILWGNIYNVC